MATIIGNYTCHICCKEVNIHGTGHSEGCIETSMKHWVEFERGYYDQPIVGTEAPPEKADPAYKLGWQFKLKGHPLPFH